jgi:lysophospholipase L1-like esterase
MTGRFLKPIAWLVYIVALCAMVEYGLRALDLVAPYTPQPELAIKLYYEDPNGLVLLRPNARYYTHGNVPMIVNADGYRDRLYPRSKPASTTRIAFVGDSFTMGDGVRMEDSYPKQLEALLSQNGRVVEVVNFGITATNTLQQLALVKDHVLDYQPDVVAVGFNLNDYRIPRMTEFARAEDVGIEYRVNADRTVAIVAPDRSLAERVNSALTERLAFARLIRQAWRALVAPPVRAAGPPRDLTSMLIQRREVPAENYDQTNQALVDMRTVVEAQGRAFVVVLLPAMTELARPHPATFADYPYRELHQKIGAYLSQNGIDYLDTLSQFRDRRIAPLVLSRFDPHFNRQGNRIIAEAVRDFLVDKGLVR